MGTQVAVTAMLWGAGTAIGEIPPYLISYSAAMAGEKSEALGEIEASIATSQHGSIVYRIKARMEQWMLRFIQVRAVQAMLCWDLACLIKLSS